MKEKMSRVRGSHINLLSPVYYGKLEDKSLIGYTVLVISFEFLFIIKKRVFLEKDPFFMVLSLFYNHFFD
jgi:hypothetical protein